MFCRTLGYHGTPVEEYWARLYFSTHMEIRFDQHRSNYTFIRFTQKCFLDPRMRFYSQAQNLRALAKAWSSPQPHVCPQSSTILLLNSITSYKDYDQTSTTTQHSISQPCSESVKIVIKWVDKRDENRVVASCKKSLLIQPVAYAEIFHGGISFSGIANSMWKHLISFAQIIKFL